MCRRIKCFGGSMHGKTVTRDVGAPPRFMAPVRKPRPKLHMPEVWKNGLLLPPKMYDIHSYHLCQWAQHGVTEQYARVSRCLTIGLLEGTDLLPQEQDDLDWEMSKQRWEWVEKPSFLTEFEQWWEWALAVHALKQPNIRFYA